MSNVIIEELKNLSLSLKKIKDRDDEKFINRADETKIYILELLSDKNDKDLKKGIINKWEEYVKEYIEELPSDNVIKKNQAKNRLQNLLKSLIKVLEHREQNSGDGGFQIRMVSYINKEIDIKEVIKDTLEIIESGNKSNKEEAKQNLIQLEKELGKELEQSGGKNWGTIRSLIKRFADFGKNEFITLMPAVLKYYGYREDIFNEKYRKKRHEKEATQ